MIHVLYIKSKIELPCIAAWRELTFIIREWDAKLDDFKKVDIAA